MSTLTPGVRLHDRYRLVTLLGEGGMAQVWRAVDEVLGRPVAVKALASPLAADPVLQSGTWREARIAAQLGHPNVTQVYDYGEAKLGETTVPYLVLELVEGQNLAERLAAGPLPWPVAARLGAEIAGALAAAHRLGLVHRDVKPGNVMLTSNGAKVLDFGIASLAGPGLDGGRLIGTPAYAGPERARPGAAEPASDVYALGAVLYEMLTGHPPRAVANWADVSRPGPIEPPQVNGLPPRFTGVVLDCLAADPKARPTAAQVASVLEDLGTRAAVPVLGPSGIPLASPTRIDLEPPVPPAALLPPAVPALAGSSARRTAVVAIALTAVVAGVIIALIAAYGPTGGTGTVTSPTTTASSAAPPTTTPPTTAEPTPSDPAVVALAIIDSVGTAVDDAVTAGAISDDAAEKIRDELSDLREKVEDGKARDVIRRAGNLREKIDDLRNDDEIDDTVAAQLIALLDPLARGSDG